MCSVADGEVPFSFCNEGDVIVSQNMYASLGQKFPGILQVDDIYQKFTSVFGLVEIVSGDNAFHGLTLYNGSKGREKATLYNSECENIG